MSTRNERAQQTRARILAAAQKLFVERGFAATTMEAIGREGGVAVQTVYFIFNNKRNILKLLLDRAVAGDDRDVPTLERPWFRAAVNEPDAYRQIKIQVDAARQIYERAAPVLDVVRSAASADPEIADLWASNIQQRRTVQRHLVTALIDKRPLHDGLSSDRAIDIAFSLQSPELYHLLVVDSGWTPQEWQQWVYDSLGQQLLG